MINKINSEINKRLATIHNSYQGVNGTDYNGILSFTRYTGEVITDEYGNATLSTTETIEIKATFQDTTPTNNLGDIASDFSRTYYRVWFVDPLTYEGEIPDQLDCQVLINGLWLSGTFTVRRNNLSSQIEITKIRSSLGWHIEGIFQHQSNHKS